MSFFSSPISSAQTTIVTAPSAPSRAAGRPDFADALSASVSVDAMPASPPPEVLDAIGSAADAYDRLAASGQHLHFDVDPPTGKVTVSVTDHAGTVLRTIPPSAVLRAAAGQPLP